VTGPSKESPPHAARRSRPGRDRRIVRRRAARSAL